MDFELNASDGQRRDEVKGTSVDVHETKTEIIATCRIPGVESKEDIEINIESNILLISGSTNLSYKQATEDFQQSELNASKFSRSISLPRAVNKNSISTSYNDGVLEVRMSKAIDDNTGDIQLHFR